MIRSAESSQPATERKEKEGEREGSKEAGRLNATTRTMIGIAG